MIDCERIYLVAKMLLECACHGLSQCSSGCPTRRCLVPGIEPEATHCCSGDGQLTVNLVRAYPTTSFPASDVGTHANCNAPLLAVVYNVQVWRCAPVGSGTTSPTCDALDRSAHTAMVDVAAITRGVSCCLQDHDSASGVIGSGFRWTLGDHTTTDVQGGCVGTNLQVVIGIPTCLEC